MTECDCLEAELRELRIGEDKLFTFDFANLLGAGLTLAGTPAPTVTATLQAGGSGAPTIGAITTSGTLLQVRIAPGTATVRSRFLLTAAATDTASSPNRHVVYGFLDIAAPPAEPCEAC